MREMSGLHLHTSNRLEALLEDLVVVVRNETIKAECAAIWEKLRDCWTRREGQIRTIFEQNSWAKYTHGNPVKMAVLLAELSKCLSDAAGAQDQLGCIKWFALSPIEKSVRVGFV